ncbi:MAG: Tm-1-like ATP-binding domain-containing protein, partial [Sphingomonadaceae bacterium]|nr:Tm-1-like ATP-binding domain-containing protein [Sphingomonadaceae bacterium]
PARFDVTLERRLPNVLSVGALDMVNFGPIDSVPPQFTNRNLHVHNATVTLMRTTAEENVACAQWIARKLNAHPDAPFTMLLPEGGVSELDKPGNAFHDPEADRALFGELERAVAQGTRRRIVRYRHHINDPAFAQAIVEEFRKAMY